MKISILTAVFNSAGVLEDCIRSVATQQGADIEHIVIDGGSTDGTLDAIRRAGDAVARWTTGPDLGMYDALNKGIGMATGDIIGILNADDFYAHDRVLATVSAAFGDRAVDSCYGDLLYVDAGDTSRVIRTWRSGAYGREKFLWGWMPPHPTFFARKRVYDGLGGFNLDFGTAADYELMLRFLMKYRISAAYIPEVLVKMRTGGMSNASLKNRLRANRMDRLAWKANGLKPYPWTLTLKPLRKVLQYVRR